MRKFFAGLIILGVVFGLALKITGCSQGGGGESSSTTSTFVPGPLSVSGTVYATLTSGYNQTYYNIPADVSDLNVEAYLDKNMTQLVISEVIDMSEQGLLGVEYSLTGFSPNTTYYLKATQRIDLKPLGLITQTLYNTGTKTLTFLASDLTGQNIFMIRPTL